MWRVTNEDRAEWAQHAVSAFAITTGCVDEANTQNMANLLANFMHLCDHECVSFEAVLEHATMHYEAECDEQGRLNKRRKRLDYCAAVARDEGR